MKPRLRRLTLNFLLYFAFFLVIVFVPLFILYFLFPKESPDVWITFLGSYLGSIIAVIGTVIVTSMQIKTERRDSLNNSLFIERYQMLNSLLSNLYNIKDIVLSYSRKIQLIKRYLKTKVDNSKTNEMKNYIEDFINGFDINQLTSFYTYSRNRLMSMDLSDRDRDSVNTILDQLLNNNRKLLVAYRDLSQVFNKIKHINGLDDSIEELISALDVESHNFQVTIKELDNLDGEIQNVIRGNHKMIISE
ncbi:hypothetical protein ACYATM_05870 [Lactobacillaceae bacterium Scapto_B20]